MAFLIGGANSAADTGYEVANSCKWNKADDAYLSNTSHTSAGSQTKWTFSCWYKKCADVASGNAHALFSHGKDGAEFDTLFINASEKLAFVSEKSGSTNLASTMVFRDYNAWYHIVCAVDTTQATAANRVKMYVNGSQITLSTTTYPAEDQTTWTGGVNNGDYPLKVGSYPYGGVYSPEGYLAEVVMINNQQLTPTSFGEFNSDSPTIWQPIDVSTLTPGTNGFYLDFEDSGTLGNDIFGNGDFGNTNLAATDQMTDTPTNNWAIWNSLVHSDIGFTEGNTIAVGTSDWGATAATIALPNAGKWYYEIQVSSNSAYGIMGFMPYEEEMKTGTPDGDGDFIGLQTNDTLYNGGGYEENKYSHSVSANDIYMFAADITDNTAVDFYFGVNGTWFGSGDPANGSNPAVNNFNCSTKTWAPGVWFYDLNALTNFGNPSFSISSGNADGDGYGNFEYAVPSGFFALNSKNVGEYGG